MSWLISWKPNILWARKEFIIFVKETIEWDDVELTFNSYKLTKEVKVPDFMLLVKKGFDYQPPILRSESEPGLKPTSFKAAALQFPPRSFQTS